MVDLYIMCASDALHLTWAESQSRQESAALQLRECLPKMADVTGMFLRSYPVLQPFSHHIVGYRIGTNTKVGVMEVQGALNGPDDKSLIWLMVVSGCCSLPRSVSWIDMILPLSAHDCWSFVTLRIKS